MNVRSVTCVCFSPTGTTKAITKSIAQGLAAESTEMVDATKRSLRGAHPLAFQSDLVILAAPVYYGRVAEEAASYFATLTAQGTPVVLVVVYGNREFDDALKELHDIAVAGGFIPIAGGAFVAEHSYSSSEYPIAQDRPDGNDLKIARQFGVAIGEKLRGIVSLKTVSKLQVPGKVPYVEPKKLILIREARATVSLTPETDTAMCTQCGECAEACPTGAISPDDPAITDKWQCLICFACVKSCPVGARKMRDPFFCSAIKELHGACQQRKEPELYL